MGKLLGLYETKTGAALISPYISLEEVEKRCKNKFRIIVIRNEGYAEEAGQPQLFFWVEGESKVDILQSSME